MKPLHDKKHTLAKRGLSLLCVLALCLGLLPVTALAADGIELYVGGQQITESGCYANQNGTWTKVEGTGPSSGQFYYDADNGTLTLNNATIQGRGTINEGDPIDYGIYAASTSGQLVALTINLIGINTVKGVGGIYITSDGNSALVIQSDSDASKGSLEVSGSGTSGISIDVSRNSSGNPSLTINNASVEASTEKAGYYGVSLASYTTSSPTLSLTVNGGSLTAQGDSKLSGIRYVSVAGSNSSTSLTVQNNALVKAMPRIDTVPSMASKPTPQGNGIVFEGNSGTVYGSVTLQDDLIIDQDETLTVPEGSSLNCNRKLTNNGTILASGGTVTGSLNDGTTVTTPNITAQPRGQTVTEGSAATFSVTASAGDSETLTYQWQQSTDNGSSWTNIERETNASYTTETTTTDMSGYQYRCMVKSASGVSVTSDVATLTVTEPTTYTITANASPAEGGSVTVNNGTSPVSVAAGNEVTLTATANSGYRFTGWMENDQQVSTNATYTFNANGDRTLTAKFEKKVTGVTLDKTTLELFTGGTGTLTATVEPDDATNKNVTWQSDSADVATVQNGTVTAVGAGEATITVTTADGNYTATCTVKVTDPVYDMTTDTTALDFGSAYTGYAQPAAQTVTVKNTGNQPVTLNQPSSTDNFEVGALSTTTLAAGETATFTVQPKTGLSVGTYSDTITVSGSENVIVTIPASFTVKSRPSYNPPTVSEETTDAIQAADPGETVTVDLSSGSTKLDKDVFETLAGKDVTLVIDLGDGVSWTVNGTDIPADANLDDLDLGVEMDSDGIPVDVVNSITGERDTVQMTLAHDGAFGFTMTLTAPLGKENAGYWANLYHYDEDAEALNFEAAAKIDADGSVTIPFSHASQYAIVIDTRSHATVDVSDLFIDIAPDAWYKDAIQYAYDNGLMTGVSATEFAPEQTTTRAMIVSILARLEGVTTAQAAGFADVTDEWYATAVNWAANVGVVNGYEDNTFQPNTAITREQLAAILMNYAAYKGEDVSNRADLTSYTDQPSTWATETMSWAVAEGLISGVTADTLQPQGAATRAQVAAILQRFLSE